MPPTKAATRLTDRVLAAAVKRTLASYKTYLLDTVEVAESTAHSYCAVLQAVMTRRRTSVLMDAHIHAEIDRASSNGLSNSYIQNVISAYQHFAKSKGLEPSLKRPRKVKKLHTTYLSEGDVSALISGARTLRVKAMIAVLAYTGIGPLETARLRVRDVKWQLGGLKIKLGPKFKQRIAHLGEPCLALLELYLASAGLKERDYLFPVVGTHRRLRASDINRMVSLAGKAALLSKPITVSLLRRSLAYNMLARGANVFLVKDQLGHKFLSSTLEMTEGMRLPNKTEFEKKKPSYV